KALSAVGRPAPATVVSAAFRPDGASVAVLTGDGVVRLWKARPEGDPLVVFKRPGNDLWCLAFHPDGRTVATGGPDQIRLWDTNRSAPQPTFFDPHGLASLAIHPAGRLCATGSAAGRVTLRDLETEEA